jgi:hypothetical protein
VVMAVGIREILSHSKKPHDSASHSD